MKKSLFITMFLLASLAACTEEGEAIKKNYLSFQGTNARLNLSEINHRSLEFIESKKILRYEIGNGNFEIDSKDNSCGPETWRLVTYFCLATEDINCNYALEIKKYENITQAYPFYLSYCNKEGQLLVYHVGQSMASMEIHSLGTETNRDIRISIKDLFFQLRPSTFTDNNEHIFTSNVSLNFSDLAN